MAEGVCDRLELDRVIWIPAATAPHKRKRSAASAEHRSAMVQIAVSDNESFQYGDIELGRGGVSYTVHTLEQLTARYPGDEMFLLMGSDSYADFASWREPERIAELASLVVYPRDGADLDQRHAFDAVAVELPRVEISSSMIRKRVRSGESTRYLVHDAVRSYIAGHRLYL